MNFSEVNTSLFRLVNDLGKEHEQLNIIFTFLAEYMVFLFALSVLCIWFTRNKESRIMIFCATITFTCAFILGKVSGEFHSNYQPFVELSDVNKLIVKEKGNSFPSDHTILFFSYCFSFWLFKRGWWIFWILLAVLVGISRIWVGVHYPFDVIAGMILSFAAAISVYLIVPRLNGTRKILNDYEKYEGKLFQPFRKTKDSKTKNY
ncbi:undecaprenyl-diphosphatase [Fictibacillus phosphorivorans]|uniref:Undecaprenyl-diphosphatase n=1 Tax=Fictibacillus phosphorivorans TaxID=1221500 RepID=A0A160ISI3_9BACL|nr:undecaprenyl-diphosphatase [Fictibacillus phosphorivorans]ANC79377.1 undecaprenyl-diphosphatase [Fictibacillus phosphorivorans]